MSYRGPLNSLNGMSDMGMGGRPGNPYAGPHGQTKSSFDWNDLKRKIDRHLKKIEDLTDHPFVEYVKPYVPTLARFFIVATFYEDSFRIISQWSDQIFYLHKWKHYPYFFVVLFLITVTVSMLCGATMLILRKQTVYATGILCSCIVLQALVYGLFTGSSFVLRNISVIGGLLIAFSDSIVKNKTTFGMLPELNNKDGRTKGYLLLAGRILIVLLFITFTLSKSWFTVFLTIINTVFFAIGYKTKLASIILGLILTFYNITLNNYWFYDQTKRDFLKYEFYQNLSIIGGLLLVTNTGAGELSVDEKKKIY
ncbi:ERV29 (YGR284C) [Zygosaccharomyces parabailii]|uniref:ZYBA0S03-01288g1_1 n=1 Tax=Zygosaccharomyces bailii (strain CLIB 213 / ATCC 58445 / CBS 680 / BCRC 21525 / NBRC 1098 / NCYC 1416 / NRRL Y-2227) TaxID=1333698 RepID=A0A8J2T635_ZYGB2|nr:ERV29 (YGR284C) [Zygosaccharomyces parabailii]CDF88758.1 ZYBA0S03-01288g1_1 [Zygosaccharomyces bailii CLIB 213]